ncbi:preprotein translocase subunit SecE [Lihuaxuella thermophila]|uniref:Protein translocase subunit SecE n=1 Tax=Lihuaxuella thermophila TaxID=1173111 RepID=A0A1H8HVJ0_9BACL|nr:preprotein translocase subunit SecE [Lihuaxuella thermophila]SEN60142.1 preprotein translocase subunit SecE [Lihuaxuella thermophila]
MAILSNIGRGIRKSVSGTAGFFRGSVQELKKVRWPSRQEMVSYTLVVIVTVVILAVFFFLIDTGLISLLNLIK